MIGGFEAHDPVNLRTARGSVWIADFLIEMEATVIPESSYS